MIAQIQPSVIEVLHMTAAERKALRNDLARREEELDEEAQYISSPESQNDKDLLMELVLVSQLLEVIKTIN